MATPHNCMHMYVSSTITPSKISAKKLTIILTSAINFNGCAYHVTDNIQVTPVHA